MRTPIMTCRRALLAFRLGDRWRQYARAVGRIHPTQRNASADAALGSSVAYAGKGCEGVAEAVPR